MEALDADYFRIRRSFRGKDWELIPTSRFARAKRLVSERHNVNRARFLRATGLRSFLLRSGRRRIVIIVVSKLCFSNPQAVGLTVIREYKPLNGRREREREKEAMRGEKRRGEGICQIDFASRSYANLVLFLKGNPANYTETRGSTLFVALANGLMQISVCRKLRAKP